MKFVRLLSLCYLPIAFSQTINGTFDFIIVGKWNFPTSDLEMLIRVSFFRRRNLWFAYRRKASLSF